MQAGFAWPSPRFSDNGNGTATDKLTGLIWTKNANLPDGVKTWQGALDYVAEMNAGAYQNFGYTDWRLPNVNELESLINANESDSATWLNTQGFTKVQAGDYWSSTSEAYYPKGGWVVNLWDGYVYADAKSDSSFCLWPVHGGQIQPVVGCSTWNDVIAKYQAYVNGQAVWGDLVACYQQVSLMVTSD